MFNNYLSLLDEFNHMFDLDSAVSDAVKYSVPSFPPCNVVILKDGSITFKFALVGYKKEDLAIEYEKDALVIKTAKDYKPIEISEGSKVLNNGIKTPAFSYKYALPESKYDITKLKATFAESTLTITIPAKEEEQKPNSFTIE